MYGWTGTLLRVDLGSGKVTREALDPRVAREYIGARGLGGYIIRSEVDPKVDALSPANKLVFAAGPLTGTFAPSAGRYNVCTKSPLNESLAASNSGGAFGPELKYAGFDAVIVEGKAAKPVYLWINDAEVEIRDAAGVWGMNVPDATDAIRAATDDEAKVACIGPAGEHLSLIANIMNEMHRAAGRTGVGAVMGSKNLKAVAVVGNGPVEVADPDAFLEEVLKGRKMIFDDPVGGTGLPAYGTEVLVNILNTVGGLPTRNWQDGHFANADKTGGEALAAKQLVRKKGCFSCIISCGRVTKVDAPGFEGIGEGPEYETAWAYGADCGVDNLDAITKANYLCNEYGMDTIAAGSSIACAMELYQRGIITSKDTDGVDLTWGNAEAIVEMTRKMGEGEGFGAKAAQGSYRLADGYGHPEYSMTTKKQEMPAYDGRAIQGIGLNYATSNRGGCHVRGYTISHEVLGSGGNADPHVTEGKAGLGIAFQNLTAALDATGSCLFATFGLTGEQLVKTLATLTGYDYTLEEFLQVGDRIWTQERLWNIAAGYTSADDTLPRRLLEEPLKTGASKGHVNKLGEMLPEYYEQRGYDEHGVPTKAKLKELSLKA
ncbi:MAG TPA: aldehyde ferredoxin oxidoreductase family protein [Thermoleophilia bacterium]|nr:aldehyde ferredoxin oxidoreductase family protein [Thermoleophilia bacterium]